MFFFHILRVIEKYFVYQKKLSFRAFLHNSCAWEKNLKFNFPINFYSLFSDFSFRVTLFEMEIGVLLFGFYFFFWSLLTNTNKN